MSESDDQPDPSEESKTSLTGAPEAADAAADGTAVVKVELDIEDAPFLAVEDETDGEKPHQEEAPSEDISLQASSTPGGKGKKRLLLVAAALVLLAAGGTLAALLLPKAEKPAPAPAPPAPPVAQAAPAVADECSRGVTPAKVVTLVREAADYLREKGDPALGEFQDPKGRFVCGDAYVIVFDSAGRLQVANPAAPILAGMDVSAERDRQGVPYIRKVGELGRLPDGGWMEKLQPRPEQFHEMHRKVFYILGVPGTRYQVGAGIYNDDLSLEALDKLTAEAIYSPSPPPSSPASSVSPDGSVVRGEVLPPDSSRK